MRDRGHDESGSRWTLVCRTSELHWREGFLSRQTSDRIDGRLLPDCRTITYERASVPRSVAIRIGEHRTKNVYRRYAIVSVAPWRTPRGGGAR